MRQEVRGDNVLPLAPATVYADRQDARVRQVTEATIVPLRAQADAVAVARVKRMAHVNVNEDSGGGCASCVPIAYMHAPGGAFAATENVFVRSVGQDLQTAP